MIQPQRARDTGASPHLKIGLAGASGVGKTTVGAYAYLTDPKKLVVVVAEAQAKAIIQLHNPEALVIHVSTFQDVQEAWEFLYRGFATGKMHVPSTSIDPATGAAKTVFAPTAEPFDFETVVLDSFSDIFRKVKGEVTQRSYRRAHAKFQASNPGRAYEEPEVTSMQDWGILQDKCIALLQSFRDLPANFLCIFGIDEREESGATSYRPALQGRGLQSALVGFFNAFGYMYRSVVADAGDQPKVVRQVLFLGGEEYTTKPLDGCDVIERPSFRLWVEKFRAKMAQVAEARLKGRQAPIALDASAGIAAPESKPEPEPEKAKSKAKSKSKESGGDVASDTQSTTSGADTAAETKGA